MSCVFLPTQDGWTALYTASKRGHVAVVDLLLQMERTDVSISKKVGHYPHIALLHTLLVTVSNMYLCT